MLCKKVDKWWKYYEKKGIKKLIEKIDKTLLKFHQNLKLESLPAQS